MADHYSRTVDLLEEVAALRTQLAAEYELNTRRPHVVAGLHDNIRYDLALAKIHSNLAVRQALQDQVSDRVTFEQAAS